MTRSRTAIATGILASAAMLVPIVAMRPAASSAPAALVVSAAPISSAAHASGGVDTLRVDPAASILRWKGTKFRGLGKHEGTVRIGDGTLLMCHELACGGQFTIDMRTIAVTDIPESDPVPRERLVNHLKDDDFFWVDRYPTATFRLREGRATTDGTYRVTGDLTMRGVMRTISFPANLRTRVRGEVRADARFTIDRQHWGIAYEGSRLTNDLVDDEITLELVLVARRGGAVATTGSR